MSTQLNSMVEKPGPPIPRLCKWKFSKESWFQIHRQAGRGLVVQGRVRWGAFENWVAGSGCSPTREHQDAILIAIRNLID